MIDAMRDIADGDAIASDAFNMPISEMNAHSHLVTPNLSLEREEEAVSPESPSKMEVEDLTTLEVGRHSTRRMRTRIAQMHPFAKVSPIVQRFLMDI